MGLLPKPWSTPKYTPKHLKIKIEDYASNEKIFYPPKKLTTEGAPASYKPSKGDVTYYSPWGDVAIFYKDFPDSKGLLKLGKITSDVDQLLKLKDSEVSIEKIID